MSKRIQGYTGRGRGWGRNAVKGLAFREHQRMESEKRKRDFAANVLGEMEYRLTVAVSGNQFTIEMPGGQTVTHPIELCAATVLDLASRGYRARS